MPRFLKRSRRAAVATLLALCSHAALAQSGKPIRFLLSVSAGSGVDVITRAAGPSLEAALGHPIVIENQPGAGGVIGTQALMRTAPDGYTLSMISANHVIVPHVLKNVPFDPVNDFTPIGVVGSSPLVVAVNPKVPAKTFKELVSLMRAKPDTVTYGSPGNGTFLHLASAALLDTAVVKGRHIPYKGGNAVVTDLMGGQIDVGTFGLPQVIGAIKNGSLRPLAVLNKERSPLLPDVPTSVEQGVPFTMDGWFMVIGPKGIPAEDVRRIQGAVQKAFSTKEVKDALAAQGALANVSTPEQARAFLQSESTRFAEIVKKAEVVAQ